MSGKERLTNLTMRRPNGEVLNNAACKNALAPYITELRAIARRAGWNDQEIGIALLATAADLLKDLGYGERIN